MSATIVVVAHNERKTLRRTVTQLLATTPASRAEVVVVDDASTDGSLEDIADLGRRVRVEPLAERVGISRARNVGAQLGTGDLLVFSDAHVDPCHGWFEPLVRQLRDGSVGVVAPAVGSLDRSSSFGYGFTWRRPDLKMSWFTERPDGAVGVPFVCGCFLAARREFFADVGGFDEGLVTWGFEDAELCLRVWRFGSECRVEPAAQIRHLFRPRFPYRLEPEWIVQNALRTAVSHLDMGGVAAVLRHYGTQPRFAAAAARIASGDTWRRRGQLSERSVVPVADLLERFGIRAVA
jgi:GT2 family glycosyltransferase